MLNVTVHDSAMRKDGTRVDCLDELPSVSLFSLKRTWQRGTQLSVRVNVQWTAQMKGTYKFYLSYRFCSFVPHWTDHKHNSIYKQCCDAFHKWACFDNMNINMKFFFMQCYSWLVGVFINITMTAEKNWIANWLPIKSHIYANLPTETP